MSLFPFNPNAGQTMQGGVAGNAPSVPALGMGFIAHWSKSPIDDISNSIIDSLTLPTSGTTVQAITTQNEVQTIDPAGATGGSFTFNFGGQNYAGGTNQVTNLDVGTSTSGTFTVTMLGVTSAAIAWNASKATLQTALRLNSKVGNDVTVTGTDGGQSGTPFILTFTGAHGSVPITVTADSTSLLGGTHTVTITSATPGVGVAYNASAATLQTALLTLTSLPAGSVVVTGTGPWVVTFSGSLANEGQALIAIVDGTTGGTGAVLTRTTQGMDSVLDVARNVTCVANVSGVTGNVVVTGTNLNGATITETLALNGTSTISGAKAFKSVTSITFPARTHSGDTVSVGVGDVLGLHHTLSNNTVIFAFINNVKESTAPTVTTDATHLESNTFTLNSDLVSGTPNQVVDVYYIVGT